MEYAVYAIHLMALVFFTVIVGGLMNHYMFQRGFAYNPRLIYPAILSVGIALYLVGGFTLWTVKGMVMALILLYASVQDMLDHYPVWIRGALHTRRTVFRVCEGITMMLDKNTYLDVIDYELEVEFSLPYRKQAEGVVQLVLSLLHRARVIQPVSKSERFFRRMDELHTRAKKAKK